MGGWASGIPTGSGRAVLIGAVVLGGMAFTATPVGASTASGPTCGPKTVTAHPAPGVGNSELFTVPKAGTVTLRQLSNTTLKVTDTDPTMAGSTASSRETAPGRTSDSSGSACLMTRSGSGRG